MKMNEPYSKKQVFRGIVWSALDRLSAVAILLIIEVILARMLSPSDYGVLAMTSVFIAIGQVFVDSGFSQALIQKQDRNEVDFSTAFYYNLGVSIIVYMIFFLFAPYISEFYETPILTKIIRIIGLNIIFSSLVLVHKTKMVVALDFKSQAAISIFSVVASGAVGITMAYKGFGVWSLVCQSLVLSITTAILFIVKFRWVPKLIFSNDSFSQLFYFGSRLTLASLLTAIYQNLYSIVIAKRLSAADLGAFSKSNQFTLMPSSVLSNVLQRVAFPYMSSFQDNNRKLHELTIKYTKYAAMLFFPLFLGLSALADSFIAVLLSDKWSIAIPVIRLLAVVYIFYPISVINMSLFQVKGETKLFLKVELFVKALGILVLFMTLKYGLLVMCLGLIFQQFMQLVITSFFINRMLCTRYLSQVVVILPFLVFSSLISFSVFYFTGILDISNAYKLILGGSIIVVSHFLLYIFVLRVEIKSILNPNRNAE